jgi:hypothetical protein
MDQAGSFVAGAANTELALLTDIIVDERKAVADASTNFEATLAKSDSLRDDDASSVARIVRDRTNVEEARLNGARARLAAARDNLATFSVAILGSSPRTAAGHATPKADEEEAEKKREKKNNKLLKRKLIAPKDDWLGQKGIILHSYKDRHRLLQHLSNMFWKLRNMLREHAEAAPTAHSETERSKGVRRANLPDLEDYDETMEALSGAGTLDLGLNKLHEASCAMYIRN